MATGREQFNPYDLEHIADIDKFIKNSPEKVVVKKQESKKVLAKGILAPAKKSPKSK